MTSSSDFDDTKIKQFRLICGSSLIAYINRVDEEHHQFILENPYRIIQTMDQKGDFGDVILAPFLELTDNEIIPITMGSVISVAEASENGKAQFLQMCYTDQNQSRDILDTVLEPVLAHSNDNVRPSGKKPILNLVDKIEDKKSKT